MMHQCPTCRQCFSQKGHLAAHLNRKRPCKPIEYTGTEELLLKKIDEIKAGFQKEIEDLRSQIAPLKQESACKPGSTNSGNTMTNNTVTNSTITNNTITTNHNNNVFVINEFGENDIEFLTENDLLELSDPSRRYNKLLTHLIRKVNCNKEAPQNHNVLITNLRSDTAQIFSEGSWVTVSKKEVLEKLIFDKEKEMESLQKSNKLDDLSIRKKMDIIDNLQACLEDDDEESLLKRPREVERVIYSHRDIIKETRDRSTPK